MTLDFRDVGQPVRAPVQDVLFDGGSAQRLAERGIAPAAPPVTCQIPQISDAVGRASNHRLIIVCDHAGWALKPDPQRNQWQESRRHDRLSAGTLVG